MGFDQVADARGLILVAPDGTPDAIRRRFWNATAACCDLFKTRVDDEAYLVSILDKVRASHAVDPKRVYFVGHSNGGFMSYRMACRHADRIAAVAVFAGAMISEQPGCAPSNPVSVLHVHGTRDLTIDYRGGSILGNRYPGARESAEKWVDVNSCGRTPAESARQRDLVTNLNGNDTDITAWSGCRGGTAVQLWTIAGGVHIPAITSSFTSHLVDFLLAHPRP